MKYDNIVVGAGISGLLCAGYLAKNGQKTLVLERGKQVGGSVAYIPFGDCTAVMHIPLLMTSLNGGVWATAARELGANIRFFLSKEPKFVFAHSDIPDLEVPRCSSVPAISDFCVEFLEAQRPGQVSDATKQRIGEIFEEIMAMPFAQMCIEWENITLKDWVTQRTADPLIAYLFTTLGASMGFIGGYKLTWEYTSAARMLVMIRAWVAGEGSTVAAYPNLVDGIAVPFAEAVKAQGGEIRTGHSVKEVLIENGKAVGVRVSAEGGEEEIYADRVIVTALWHQVESVFKEVPQELTQCLEAPKQIHCIGVNMITTLKKPITDEPTFIMVVDPKTGDNIGGMYAQSVEQHWNAPKDKQLIWMYTLHDKEVYDKLDPDSVTRDMNDMLEKQFPGFKENIELQRAFVGEGRSHYQMSACKKISHTSPDVSGLYFAGSGTGPSYATIFEGSASSGVICAKEILGLDKLAGI